MRFALVAAFLSLALLLGGDSADAAGKKKKNKAASLLSGAIVSVEPSAADPNVGKVTIKTKANKKKATESKEVTFQVTKTTTVEQVTGKKGEVKTSPAYFRDLKAGTMVTARVGPGNQAEARSLQVRAGKKKNN